MLESNQNLVSQKQAEKMAKEQCKKKQFYYITILFYFVYIETGRRNKHYVCMQCITNN